MHNRIKEIRNHFRLSQAKFGEKIGVGQQAVGKIELGITKVTERNFEAICREFKINPNWLRTGEGEMFDTTVKTTLDELCEEYKLGETERQILEMYLEFPAEQRAIISEFIEQTLELTKKLCGMDAAKERRRQELLNQREKIDAELATMDGDATTGEESSDAAG